MAGILRFYGGALSARERKYHHREKVNYVIWDLEYIASSVYIAGVVQW